MTSSDRGLGLGRRQRLAVLAVLLALGLIVLGWSGADAQLVDEAAASVVVSPGETLWDVAVATAPDGVDPRAQLRELMALNGFDSSGVPAWTVVLVPAA